VSDALNAEPLVVHEEEGTARITVTGELDAREAQRLRELLLGTINDTNVRTVVVDCSRVTFIDSTGLGALVMATKRAVDREVLLVLQDPSPRVQQLLELTGLDKVLNVATTEDR